MLDVGCGLGDNLAFFRQRGWDMYGTELELQSEAPAWLANRISHSDLRDGPWTPGSFDCVTFFNTLEHLPDPVGQMEAAWRLLKTGGSIFVEAPNLDSWQARFFKDRWFHLDAPRHLYHFRPAVLQRLLESAGFVTELLPGVSYEYELFGWVQSAQNAVSRGQNLLYGELKRAGLVGRQVLFACLALLLSAAALPAGVAASRCGAGAMLRMHGRKLP